MPSVSQSRSVGDPVGLIVDKSGSGNDATQSDAGKKPTYKTDGTLHWLLFDGTSDLMDMPPAANGAPGSDNTAAVGVNVDAAGFRAAFGNNNDFGFELLFTNGLIRPVAFLTNGAIVANGTTNNQNNDAVISMDYSRSGNRLRAWVDQGLEVNATGAGVADKRTVTTSWLGQANMATSAFFSGKMYQMAIYDSQLSDDDRVSLESFVAGKSGVTL